MRRVSLNKSGNRTRNRSRGGEHDDRVFAAAPPVWQARRAENGLGKMRLPGFRRAKVEFQRFFRKECSTEMVNARMLARWCAPMALAALAMAQTPSPTITLPDALQRARQYGGQVQSANLGVLQAAEDRFQAEGAPAVGQRVQSVHQHARQRHALGVFVANDGVHIYNEQAVVHEEVLMLVRHGEMQSRDGGRSGGAREGRGRRARPERDRDSGLLRDRGAQRKAANAETVAKPSGFWTSPRSRNGAARWRTPTWSRRKSTWAAPARSAGRRWPSKKRKSRWAS